MAKPNISVAGNAAAWGDLSDTTEPMLGNLFAVVLTLPLKLSVPFIGGSKVISVLASGVTLPDEAITVEEVQTKLSSYDVVVGKERGELAITFKEQVGAPVSQIMSAWHKLIVDARSQGIGFPSDYAKEVWIAALAGNGTPYYWWGFKRCFPKARGANPTFNNEDKTPISLEIPFSYVEMTDATEALTGEGSLMATRLGAAAVSIGFGIERHKLKERV